MAKHRSARQWALEQQDMHRRTVYRTNTFLTAFFERAVRVLRQRYGTSTSIMLDSVGVTIHDENGHLGTGETLRDAMAIADKKIWARRNGVRLEPGDWQKPLSVLEAERRRQAGGAGTEASESASARTTAVSLPFRVCGGAW